MKNASRTNSRLFPVEKSPYYYSNPWVNALKPGLVSWIYDVSSWCVDVSTVAFEHYFVQCCFGSYSEFTPSFKLYKVPWKPPDASIIASWFSRWAAQVFWPFSRLLPPTRPRGFYWPFSSVRLGYTWNKLVRTKFCPNMEVHCIHSMDLLKENLV